MYALGLSGQAVGASEHCYELKSSTKSEGIVSWTTKFQPRVVWRVKSQFQTACENTGCQAFWEAKEYWSVEENGFEIELN